MPGRFLESYQSFPLASGDSLVTHAVIVVHGAERNANDYFTSMNEAATLAGRSSSTIIIAPQFQTSDDAPAADEPVWTSSGWRSGDLSSSTGPLPRISSYAAIDTILVRLGIRTKFPRLARIVLVGHSAGGQLLHRYAATSRVATTLTDIPIRYIAANPSTWLYLGPERAAGSGFAIPTSAATCVDYDDWHYGLHSRNTYANALPVSLVRQNLVTRDVIVMLGTADTLTADLDVSCGADLQGPRRYQRGLTLLNYMNALTPGNSHRLVTIPGVGHSKSAMFTSVDGRRAIFP
ncbi:alpha/beta hydrolase [Gemmatimonas sp.]|uniref:alpha/beta hydrolase n=1 Tax=Gemmatimonas sp. TaxID=1962908 RepID=UPI003566F161